MTNAMLIILYRPVKRCVHTVAPKGGPENLHPLAVSSQPTFAV
jgi:hypothetical protein